MQTPQRLIVSHSHSANQITVTLTLDGVNTGVITITFGPEVATVSTEESALIAAAAGAIAGQSCLAPVIEFDFAIAPADLALIRRITQIIYDSHAHEQQKPFVDVTLHAHPSDVGNASRIDSRKAVLLWSGGKDGVAALLALRANGFDVTAMHSTANYDAKTVEQTAAYQLAEHYKMPLGNVKIEWDSIRVLTRKYSNSYDCYPIKNFIPHGRDFLLACIAGVLANRMGAQYVCAGFERELWITTVASNGRTIHKDSQSAAACIPLNGLLQNRLGVNFFSPVAAFSDYSIFRHVMSLGKPLWQQIQSCFWGNWCGECIKCVNYALMEKELGHAYIPFAKPPLDENSKAYMRVLTFIDQPNTYKLAQKTYCFASLFERGALAAMPETSAFLEQRKQHLHANKAQLLAELEAITPAELVPAGFRYSFN